MRVKHGCITVALAVAISGCASTSPQVASFKQVHGVTSDTNTKSCEYNLLSKTEFVISARGKGVTNYDYIIDPSIHSRLQREQAIYKELESGPFKVMSTGHPMKYAEVDRIVFDGNAYEVSPITTALVTPACRVFYFNSLPTYQELSNKLQHVNGNKLSPNDFLDIIGPNAYRKLKFTTSIHNDEFDDEKKVETNGFDDFFIRGARSNLNGFITYNQLYADVTFHHEWGGLRYAQDKYGNEFDLVRIDTDADCQRYGCELTETVGVSLSFEYLKKHQNGITIKLSGKKSVILTIPEGMIKAYLDAMESIQ